MWMLDRSAKSAGLSWSFCAVQSTERVWCGGGDGVCADICHTGYGLCQLLSLSLLSFVLP